jgi:endonuclease-3 related protein
MFKYKNKINNLYFLLLSNYGKQGWWPILNKDYKLIYNKNKTKSSENKKLEIIIGCILAQNTSWKQATLSLINLKKNNLLNLENILKTDSRKIAQIIKSSGYNNQKAIYLKNICVFLKHTKKLPLEKDLLNVKGIGLETCHSILLYAYNKPFFIIDTYTKRLFNRIFNFKLTKNHNKDYRNLQELIISSIVEDQKIYKEFHALIVLHCKKYCLKRNPKCHTCFLKTICSYYKNQINFR